MNEKEKSAILKGRTLVNLDGGTLYLKTDVNANLTEIINIPFKQNLIIGKKYLVIFNVSDNNLISTANVLDLRDSGSEAQTSVINIGSSKGIIKSIITAQIEANRFRFRCQGYSSGNTISLNNFLILEYQEGMENWDIPYFTGMQSVKLPVLTTTGKNLFDGKLVDGYINSTTGQVVSGSSTRKVTDYIEIKNNTQYISSGFTYTSCWEYDKNKQPIKQQPTNPFISSDNAKYVRFTINSELEYTQIQIEESSVATSYEPYKSNILTVNEDVELRGIGDVQDTLDCLTGEVTENLIEFSINSESEIRGSKATIGSHTNTSRYRVNIKDTFGIDVENNYGLSDKIPYKQTDDDEFHFKIGKDKNACFIYVPKSELTTDDWGGFVEWAKNKDFKLLLKRSEKSIKTVDLTIKDQDNQPQDRMKIYPSGYIKTSSSTIPPILELKGIVHNNKLNMTTTNGVYTNNIQSLTNPILDGIICRDGTIVRDSYDVESGLYTKRVFRFTIDEEFIERYRGKWNSSSNAICFEPNLSQATTSFPKSSNGAVGIANNMTYNTGGEINRVCVNTGGTLYVRLLKEELVTYDIDGLLEWVKRNGAIEVAYPMATPQIIHMQPNMTPYVSTRPYQGEINSQGNALESSFLDYTQEESILSPKPLGEGDVLRWEQGSQCYVYENDKDYIPLTDYNQKVGTVLDLEDDEQFVENLDGGKIVVDVPFKEKAVYERELVSYEDTVIYPTNTSADPDGKVEVDYICGATWQNPDDLSDIQHLGTLREDGQYDVTIRRSGDDEIRFMNGTTHLSLDHEGLNPSEFELTYYNKDSVEVGKYGDTSHILENTLVDGKLETGMVYGETMVNVLHGLTQVNSNSFYSYDENSGVITIHKDDGSSWTSLPNICPTIKPNTQYTVILYELNNFRQVELCFHGSTITTRKTTSTPQVITTPSETEKMVFKAWRTDTSTTGSFKMLMLEGDYTSYPMDIPFFEGVNSTIVNGFTTTGKNLLGGTSKGRAEDNGVTFEWDNGVITINGCKTTDDSYLYLRDGRISTYCTTDDKYSMSYKIIGGEIDSSDCRLGNTVGQFTLTDNTNTHGLQILGDSTTNKVQNLPFTGNLKNTMDKCWFRVHRGAKFNNVKIQFQLENGGVATEFEEHKLIQHTLPTPITLNKVGDVADTYDVVSGVETRKVVTIVPQCSQNPIVNDDYIGVRYAIPSTEAINSANFVESVNNLGLPFINNDLVGGSINSNFGEAIGRYMESELKIVLAKSRLNLVEYNKDTINKWLQDNLILYIQAKTPQKIQHTLIPSTVEMMQEPTFILPQPLRSVPNGICDRLYWDENKGHYCIEKRVEQYTVDGSDDELWKLHQNSSNNHPYYYGLYNLLKIQKINNNDSSIYFENFKPLMGLGSIDAKNSTNEGASFSFGALYLRFNANKYPSIVDITSFKAYFNTNPMNLYYPLATSEIIDLPHLNRKLELPTLPDELPIGYKAVHPKMNPQIGLTIPYKQLNPPSQPQNLDFQMNKEDYVLTWNDVKEARQYNVILNDNIVATTKVPWYNTGEEIHGYILVEAQNEIADNLSKELYVKTVPKAPAQLTVAHNGLTDNYDFEISFIKSTSSLADRYTVQYRVDGGEWIIQDIPANEVDANVKVLWKFSVFEIKNQIEVWATATNDMGTNDILPLSTYYMTPTPQWTYRINSREVFLRWVDESPYDTQYKLRYQYKSDGIYRYAHFEGDKEEIGKLYEAVVALAEDDEVTLELCVISDRENLYCKPIKASKALDPNILPPKNFNYRWLSRGLIEFYWEDVYDVDLEYEAIVEHRLSGEISWIEDRRVISATDTEGTGTVYRLQYQMEDLEEIRVKVRMKWAMNETEWSESLTTVFIPVEGNPPQWIRRTQTQEGLLVEWEAQEYIDSYHVYVKGDGVELQHLETRDNFIYVDIDYSNPIDIEIYEVSRFTGGIEAEPSDSMRFIPHQNKQQMINNIYHPDSLKYEIEVDTVQKAQKASYQINDINTTPDVRTREAMDVSISSPFIITYHPLEVDVHQKGVKSYGVAETHIKTLDVKTRETVEVLTFERITDKYGMDFTVYTPFASKYPVNLEINQVRIVCLGDSLTSGHPLYWAESGTGDVTASYPYQLAKRLKNQYEVINKGYGSDTTDRCLARFDKDVLAYSPQYCLYQCGTNDKVYVVVKSFELLGTP